MSINKFSEQLLFLFLFAPSFLHSGFLQYFLRPILQWVTTAPQMIQFIVPIPNLGNFIKDHTNYGCRQFSSTIFKFSFIMTKFWFIDAILSLIKIRFWLSLTMLAPFSFISLCKTSWYTGDSYEQPDNTIDEIMIKQISIFPIFLTPNHGCS